MEVYYKDLISKEATLEDLVDNLALVVQGADELAESMGEGILEEHKAEIATRLQRLKWRCRNIRQQAINSAFETDKLVHEYPYSSIGLALAAGFGLAFVASRMLSRRRH